MLGSLSWRPLLGKSKRLSHTECRIQIQTYRCHSSPIRRAPTEGMSYWHKTSSMYVPSTLLSIWLNIVTLQYRHMTMQSSCTGSFNFHTSTWLLNYIWPIWTASKSLQSKNNKLHNFDLNVGLETRPRKLVIINLSEFESRWNLLHSLK